VELPPILETATQAHGTIQDHEAYRALADEIDRHRDQLGPILREQLDKAAAITPPPMMTRAVSPDRHGALLSTSWRAPTYCLRRPRRAPRRMD
jgi:hypothetical protein